MSWLARWWPWLALAIVTAVAGWLRFWQLADWPPGLEYDEGLAGVNALEILGGNPQIYFREAYREPLYVYLLTPFVAVFGREVWALRLSSMLLGIG